MLVRMNDGSTNFLDFREKAPGKASATMYQDEKGNVIPNLSRVGYKAVGVPGSVKGMVHAQQRYGKLSLAQVVAPAIRLARDGFEIDWYVALSFALYAERLWKAGEAKRIFFRPSGAPLRPPIGTEPSDRVVQTDLARTLERIARDGPDVLYRGEIGRASCRERVSECV